MKIELKDIDLSFMRSIPKETALEMKIISLKEDQDDLYFYTDKISDTKAAYLSLFFNKKIRFIEGDEKEVVSLITSCYGAKGIDETSETFIEEQFNRIVNQAIEKEASDIHIEPQKKWTNIRFRIDGRLTLINKIQTNEYNTLVNRIKLEGSMDIADRLRAQDGKISFKYNNKNYDLRVSSLPTVYGEKIVIRVLYKKNELIDINNLNFNCEQRKKLRKLLALRHGMLLVNGPTGSGKSTTLYAILNAINKEGINISTVEDPVEFYIDGVTQTSVNEKVGLNFFTGLKYILRQDPDVILIGEIRDEETAKMAVRASITGHKVYSTIHTNNGHEVYSRLIDMGVEEYLAKEAIKGTITQRLVRTLCDGCKEIHNLTKEEYSKYGISKLTKIYKGTGCASCGYTGYKGRTMVSEVMVYNAENVEKNYKGMLGAELLEGCIGLVERGKTSLEEYIMLKEGELMDG